MAQRVKRLPAMQETGVRSLGGEEHLEKDMATYSIFLPGKFHGQRSPVQATVHGLAKSRTPLSDFTFTLR